MSRSLGDSIDAIKAKYYPKGKRQPKYADYKVGDRVRIITYCQDMMFFRGTETGVVESNSGDYLGLHVKLDVPIKYADGQVLESWGFEPTDLVPEAKFKDYTKELAQEQAIKDVKEAMGTLQGFLETLEKVLK